MLNMVQTGVSPIYGITSWLKCADICQSKKECQYWQWTPVQTRGSADTAACYIVTNFTGFTTDGFDPNGSTADGIVTGARNCPLSTDTLTTLCPSKGANSLMWRDSNEKNGKFIPESTLKEGKYHSF